MNKTAITVFFIAWNSLFFTQHFAQMKIEELNETALEKIIKERNGKILLLNIWATWCQPCKEEFPDLIKISEEYKNQPVEIIGLSIDYPDEKATRIIPFLKIVKSNFKNYVNGFFKDDDLINFIDAGWKGALPATVLYGLKGDKILFMPGKRSYAEFKTAIENVLNSAKL